jgi:hypothetical protein
MSLADELMKLQELYERGALSHAEYEQAKAALLDDPPPERPYPPARAVRRDALGEAAKTWVHFQIVMAVLGLIVAAVFFFAFFLPKFQEGRERRDQFDRDFERTRQQMERDRGEFRK